MDKDPTKRPSVLDLLEHPLIKAAIHKLFQDLQSSTSLATEIYDSLISHIPSYFESMFTNLSPLSPHKFFYEYLKYQRIKWHLPNSTDSGTISITLKESRELIKNLDNIEIRKWPLEESTWKLEFVGVSGQTSWVGGFDEKLTVNDNDRTIKSKQLIDQGYCTMIIQNKMIVVGGNMYLNFYEMESLKLLRSEEIPSIVYVMT